MPLLAAHALIPTLIGGVASVGVPTVSPGVSDTHNATHNLKALLPVFPGDEFGGAYAGHIFSGLEVPAAVPAALSVNFQARTGLAAGEFVASIETGVLHIVRLGDMPYFGGGIV